MASPIGYYIELFNCEVSYALGNSNCIRTVSTPFFLFRVIYPTKTTAGMYAELELKSFCINGKKFDSSTDSCV